MTVRELITKIGFKVDEQQLSKVEKTVQKVSMGMKIGFTAAVAAMAAIGKSAITAAADMEMLTTQFEVMLGSAEKAAEIMNQLKIIAAETPFALEDLGKGVQQLLSFGVKSEDVLKTLKMLGDTAGGSTEKLNGLVLAYGKVVVKGKVSMEELNMLAERGLPIYEVLAKQLGVTRTQFFKMISAGKVSAADMKKAFETMTSEGGMFFEGMKKQSMTFHGLVSTMRDNFKLLLAEIGTEFMPVMKEIVKIITDLTKGPLKDFIQALVSNLQPILKLIMALLEPLLKLIAPIFEAFSAVLTPLIEIISALLIPVFNILTPIVQLFSNVLKRISDFISAVFVPLFVLLGKTLTAISPILDSLLSALFEVFNAVLNAIQPILESFVLLIETALKPLFPILKILSVVFKFLANLIKLVFQALQPFFDILALIVELVANLLNPIMNLFLLTLEPIVEVFKLLLPLLSIFADILEFLFFILQPTIMALEWTIEAIAFVSTKLKELIAWLVDVFDDEHIFNKGGKDSTVKVELPAAAESLKKGITQKMANVSMTNNIGVTAKGNLANTAGAKQALSEAARAIFTTELQKILVNAGY